MKGSPWSTEASKIVYQLQKGKEIDWLKKSDCNGTTNAVRKLNYTVLIKLQLSIRVSLTYIEKGKGKSKEILLH